MAGMTRVAASVEAAAPSVVAQMEVTAKEMQVVVAWAVTEATVAAAPVGATVLR